MECYPRSDDYIMLRENLDKQKFSLHNSHQQNIDRPQYACYYFSAYRVKNLLIMYGRTGACTLYLSLCALLFLLCFLLVLGASLSVSLCGACFLWPSSYLRFFSVFFSFALSSQNFLKCTLNCHPC